MDSEQVKDLPQRSGWKILALVIVFCLPVLPMLFLLRTYVIQSYHIPSGSNWPALMPGDYVWVSKWGYEPARGDMAIFKLPKDEKVDYVKRIIGLPGDRVQMIDGKVILNGKEVPQVPVRLPQNLEETEDGPASYFLETLPEGASYVVTDLSSEGFSDNTEEYFVPEGHYLVLGDNRDNSQDSRHLSEFGYIPRENFVGQVEMLIFNSQGYTLVREPIAD